MEARFDPTVGCAVLGIFWAGWHLPLFFAPGWTSSPFWIYVLIVISLSLIIGFVTNVARFAVVPAIVTHAMFNTVSRFLNGLFKEVQPSAAIPFELVLALGASVLVLCCCFLRGDDLGIRTLSIRVKKHQKFPSCPEWVFVPNSYDRSQSVRCPSPVPGRLSQLTRRILCAIRVRSLLIAGPRRFSKPSSRTPRSPRGCPTR
ncbi:MAG: hypothetical protein JO182_26490 [Acidobacteriaceae bacterium]|nr:hypothetical protein [Acidobacteriaceae bacterium]